MARRQGGSKAVNAALSQYSDSSSFDGQTDPEEDFDDDFSKYILTAHDPIAPVKSYNNEPQAPKADVTGDDDDISGFSFDDNESSENEAWAGKSKQKSADFSSLAEEVFDEEALIALGKSIKFGKDKDNQESEPTNKNNPTYDSDEEFSPEGIVNTLSDRFAPFEFEPAPQPEVVVYEKNEFKPKQESEPEPENRYEPEPEIKSDIESEIESEIESAPEPQPEPEKKPIFTAAAFAGLAEAVAAAEAAEAAGAEAEAVSSGASSPDDMDATPSVEVDDNTVFPAEPPIGYKKPTPKTAREIAQERIAAGTARTATADEIKAEAETKPVSMPTESKPTAQTATATATTTQAASTSPTPAQSAPAATATPKAPPKEIVSLRDLSTGFNDAEYEKQTGTLPVLGELTDEFTGGKRISGKTTRTDDQIQLMRKQEALAMNILSEDSSNAGTVRAERIIYDLHEKNEKKSRLIGRILLISGNALLFAVAIIGMIFYEGDNSGLAFMFRVTIGIGAVGFIPVKFLQKLISPFMILLSLLYVLLGLAGQDPVAANIAFYTVGVVAGLFGFTIRFFIPAVKNLFERRKP
jgi:hypothetical protein